MKRNFDRLEVGKYYVSAEEPNWPVFIDRPVYNRFISSEDVVYNSDGTFGDDGIKLDDLVTEVTVTITPVETRKPRECWVIYKGDESCVPYETRQDALAWLGDRVPTKDVSLFKIIHMREVMEGDE